MLMSLRMSNLTVNFQIVKNMLRDKGKKKIEEFKTVFNPKRFSEEKNSNPTCQPYAHMYHIIREIHLVGFIYGGLRLFSHFRVCLFKF